MESAFTQAVADWHDFYMLTGTSAATLVGLLFVSVSLHLDAVVHEVRTLAEATLSQFLAVLAISIVFVIPSQSPLGIGVPILVYGLFGIRGQVRFARRHREALQRTGAAQPMPQYWESTLAYVALVLTSVPILLSHDAWLYALVFVSLALLMNAAVGSWRLLLELRASRESAT